MIFNVFSIENFTFSFKSWTYVTRNVYFSLMWSRVTKYASKAGKVNPPTRDILLVNRGSFTHLLGKP